MLTHKPPPTHTTQLQELKTSLNLTQVGMIIRLNHAVQEVSIKLETTAFNATPHTSSIQLIKNADHVHLITPLTTKPEDATVKFHAPLQEQSTHQATNANAQLIMELE